MNLAELQVVQAEIRQEKKYGYMGTTIFLGHMSYDIRNKAREYRLSDGYQDNGGKKEWQYKTGEVLMRN